MTQKPPTRQRSANDSAPLFEGCWRMYEMHLRYELPAPTPEHEFNRPQTAHAFDWAFPEQMLAVEVEGGTRLQGGGRHNTDRDRFKYSLATALGWSVMRVTPESLNTNPFQFCALVYRALKVRGAALPDLDALIGGGS